MSISSAATVYDFWPALTSNADVELRLLRDAIRAGPKGVGTWLELREIPGQEAELRRVGRDQGLGLIPAATTRYSCTNMIEFFRNNAGAIGFKWYFNMNSGGWVHRLQDNPRPVPPIAI